MHELARSTLRHLPGRRTVQRMWARHWTDYYVLSYPKSGRTWIRFMLGKALCSQFQIDPARASDVMAPRNLAKSDRRVPHIRFTHDDDPHLKRVSELEQDKTRYGSKAVVLLVRDPRDVVVSWYFHHSKRTETRGAYTGSLSAFIRHEVFGIEGIVEFMNTWARSRSIPRSLLLTRYEDFVAEPQGQLRRLLDFLGVQGVTATTIDAACAAGSFDRMRQLEASGGLGERLEPRDPQDPDSFKVRRGEVGGYQRYLDDGDSAYAEAAMEHLDPWFRYEATS